MKKLFVAFVLLCAIPGFTQINFEPGYFISNNAIQTECYIRNMAWKDAPVKFEYTLEENGPVRQAAISEVKEFSVSGYKFRRYTIHIDRASNNTSYLSQTRNPEFKSETLFLKVLVEGKANLYQYEDHNLVRYFISTGTHDTAEQLVFKEYIAKHNEISTNSYFRQQLFTTLQSDKLSAKDFENLDYKKDPLMFIFLKYNENNGTLVTHFEKQQNQGSVNFKVIAGVNYASLDFRDSNSGYQIEANFDSKAALRIGLEVEYIMPFNQNKWSLFVNPNYQSFSATTTGKFNYKTTASVDYKFLEIPFGLRHHMYLNKKNKIFIGAGYALTLPFNSSLSYGPGAPYEISRSSGLFAGAGFSYDRYSAEVRYNFLHGIMEYVNFEAKYHSIALNLGFRFL